MSTDVEESRGDKSSIRVAPPSPALLTRAEAAALLRCSISSVRRLEGDVLHAIVGADGVHRFDPAELARVASRRSSRSIDGSKEGERDARVFEAFEEGKGLREIVTTFRIPADLVSRLHTSWLKMGSNQEMILSSSRLAQLRTALHAEVKRPTDLVDEVQWLAEQCNGLEAERNHLDDQLSELMNAVGKAVAHGPDLAKELSDLSKAFAPELAKRFAAAVAYFAEECAPSPKGPPSTERNEAQPSKSA